MWIVLVAVAAMFMLVRCKGLRLVDTRKPNLPHFDEFQFSVSHVIGLTAVAALVLAFARFLAPMIVNLNVIMTGLAIAVCLGALAVLASLTVLRRQRSKIGIRVLSIVTLVVAGLVYVIMEVTDADPGVVWGSVIVVYAVVLRSLLQLVHARGFSLVSISEVSTLGAETEL